MPTYEEDRLVLFESGSIVMHTTEWAETRMPSEPHARARARAWMLAALNSVEPAI